MIKNKTAQLMLQTSYVTLGIIVIAASMGLFEIHEGFLKNFYINFTNVSNFLCIGVMLVGLIGTIKAIKKGETGYTNKIKTLKFIGLVWMTITFCIFNFMLAGAEGRHIIIIDGVEYIAKLPIKDFRVGSILAHLVLPILYMVDWVLFYEHGKVKWYTPLISLLGPLVYIIVVYVRAGIMLAMGVPMGEDLMFPYAFLEFSKMLPLVLLGFLVGFTGIGYIWFGVDKILKKISKKIEDKK